jgi:hypothetical protein
MQHLCYKFDNVTIDDHFLSNSIPFFKDETYYSLENDPDFILHDKTFSLEKHKNMILNKYYVTPMLHKAVCSIDVQEDHYKYNNKGFIRFELLKIDDICDALKQISDIRIDYIHGGSKIYTISLQLNLILMKEYGLNITIIDIEQFLAQHTDDDIDNLIHKNNGKNDILNCKYVFKNKKGFYLDIPLFEEFYGYGKKMPTLIHHKSLYEIHFSKNISYDKIGLDIGNKVMLGFEEIVCGQVDLDYNTCLSTTCNIYDSKMIKELILTTQIFNTILIKSDNKLYIDVLFCKFLFIVVEKNLNNAPNLVKISYIMENFQTEKKSHITIPIDNTIMYDFDDTLVYGISTNPCCNMSIWTSIKTEPSDPNNLYFTCNHVDFLSLTFDNVCELTKISIISVSQNTQQSTYGMTGTEFCH